MLLRLLFFISLSSPTATMTSHSHKTVTPANPSNSGQLSSLSIEKSQLLSKHSSLERKQDFWNSCSLVLAVIAAGLGIAAGATQRMGAKRALSLRVVDTQLSAINTQAAALEKQASDQKIAAIRERSNDAARDAAKAKQQTETERLERVKLEAEIAPRRLSQSQQESIGKKCLGLSVSFVVVKSYTLDTEGAALGLQIYSALHSSGIPVIPRLASLSLQGGLETGVLVNGKGEMERFATCLAQSLHTIGGLSVSLNGTPLGNSNASVLGQPMGETGLFSDIENEPHVLVMVAAKPIVLSKE